VRSEYKILVGNPEKKSPLGRYRRRWEDNIRMDLREMGCEFVDWIHLAQDKDQWRAVLNTVMVDVELSLCLTKHHAMKAYWGTGGISPLIL
jgi:hypothetical protein